MKTIRNLAAKVAALLSAFSLTMISVPQVSFTAYAEEPASVRVIVENTTFTEAIDGTAPVWTGTKIDTWVELDESDDAMTCIKKAIESEGLTQTGAEYGYITEIAGLSAYDGGYMSGWMGTLNDWFTDEAFTAYTVANGKLADGDELRMQYSLDWGADLGYDWSGTDTSLKAIECTEGTLSPDFSPSVYEYTLTVPFGTESISFRPTALNKNFKVVSTIGEKTLKLTRPTEISDNDVITVTVGTGTAASQYKIKVKQGERPAPRFESLAFSAYALDGWDNSAFSPEIFEYDVRIKNYNTSTISLTSSTKYDSDLLRAVAVYTDSNGSEQNIEIKSGAFSYLTNIPFGSSTVVIELRYSDDDSIKTQYKFNFTRPYNEEELDESDKEAIKAAEEAIDSIGRVTAYSGEAIDTAREAYNAVPDRIKDRVNNADILVSAEERYAEITAIKTAGAGSKAHYAAVLEKLCKNEIYPVQSIGGEWTVIALARAGALSEDTAEKYYSSLCTAVEEIGSARLSERKPSENARVIIALAAIGKDPTDVSGYNLLSALDDMEYIEKQGINAAIYALIAFDCTDYDAYIHDELIEYILSNMTGGGWALAGDTADVDVTAMAIQALAPYIDDEKVSTAVESGLTFLSDSLDENCGYSSCESISQTLIALAAMGIDPLTDERFIVDGITLTDALEAYATESGYKHIIDGEENLMATEQAALALTAYELSKNGSSLYDLSTQTDTGDKPLPDGIVNPGDSSGTPTDKDYPENPDSGVALTGGVTVLLSGIAMLISGKKRKQK